MVTRELLVDTDVLFESCSSRLVVEQIEVQ